MLSVIIPASNEETWIGPCLAALFAAAPPPGGAEAIVVANGCHDLTAARAYDYSPLAEATGWQLQVIDRPEAGKPGALNAGDAVARGDIRAYLDADVSVSAPLMAEIVAALAPQQALYAAGTPQIPRPASAISRAYARFWQKLPFNRSKAAGYGLFAVNAAGRARWDEFPNIISDDTWVRLQFWPDERIQVKACYDWPMIEGYSPLVRVRRRQNAGVDEIARLWPELMQREAKIALPAAGLARLALTDPTGFLAYGAIIAGVRSGWGGRRRDSRTEDGSKTTAADWARGR
jgi:glycosyltransferase involved in cell wall biosynthesis